LLIFGIQILLLLHHQTKKNNKKGKESVVDDEVKSDNNDDSAYDDTVEEEYSSSYSEYQNPSLVGNREGKRSLFLTIGLEVLVYFGNRYRTAKVEEKKHGEDAAVKKKMEMVWRSSFETLLDSLCKDDCLPVSYRALGVVTRVWV